MKREKNKKEKKAKLESSQRGFLTVEILIVLSVLLGVAGSLVALENQAGKLNQNALEEFNSASTALVCGALIDAMHANNALTEQTLSCLANENEATSQAFGKVKKSVLINNQSKTIQNGKELKVSVGKNAHYQK